MQNIACPLIVQPSVNVTFGATIARATKSYAIKSIMADIELNYMAPVYVELSRQQEIIYGVRFISILLKVL